MRQLVHIMLFCFALICVGCASKGNTNLKAVSQADIATLIEEGKTTKAQVQALFGPPDALTYSADKHELWHYGYATSTQHATNFIPVVNLFSSGADIKTKELVILIDADGIVQRCTLRESNSVTRYGILGKS